MGFAEVTPLGDGVVELKKDAPKIDPHFYEKLKNIFNRRRNNEKLSPIVAKKREQERKRKRRQANKSRNINQKKNKLK